MEVATIAERPDLEEPGWQATSDIIPEYNNHGDVLNRYWGRLIEERPGFQFHLLGDDGEILARAHSIPLRWDGRIDDLPAGIDGAIARGFDEGGANVLCALLIRVPRALQGRGVSAVAVQAMADLARREGLQALIAPVRPSYKERYPLVSIERYARWRRADGLLFDPWMRVHERLGATVLKPEPHSLRISSTILEWEQWTGMTFPDSGEYWFPGGLATLEIDLESDRGRYWEPNVWMNHAFRRVWQPADDTPTRDIAEVPGLVRAWGAPPTESGARFPDPGSLPSERYGSRFSHIPSSGPGRPPARRRFCVLSSPVGPRRVRTRTWLRLRC